MSSDTDIDVSNTINLDEGLNSLAVAILEGSKLEAEVTNKAFEVAERFRVAALILGAGALLVWWSRGKTKRNKQKRKK